MSYDPTKLDVVTLTDVEWALAWTRFLLRDTTDTEVYSDAEALAVIKAFAWTHTTSAGVSTTYYRPHQAAASLIESDPDRASTEAIMGVSLTTRKPGAIASAIRRAGRWVDDLIVTATDGVRPPSGRELTPVW